MKKVEMLRKTNLIKTLLFNFKYFGIRGILLCPVLIARNVKLECLEGKVQCNDPKRGGIKLGYSDLGIIDSRYQKAIWENKGIVIFEGRANLGKAVKICNSGCLTIGDCVSITGGTSLICRKNISIGAGTLISWENLIMDTDWHPIYSNESGEVVNSDKNICIGKHVWIGCRCTILKGTNIPDENVIAANSKISESLSKEMVIYGNQGAVIRENIRW